MAHVYDVFLSHNSKDKPAVREIAELLRARGLRPWLDVDELIPGRPWQEALEEIIGTCRTAAVLVGQSGIGPWQEPEMRGCLDEFVRRKLPVIPVLLPGAPRKPRLPLFLRAFTWVDLRAGLTSEGLDLLVRGIQPGKPTARRRKAQPPPPSGPPLHNLPFPTLGPLFTGRDEALRHLEESLAHPGGAAAIVQSEAIYGLGGIGKTRLAVEHAWRCGHRYTAAWFVQADSPENLRRGLGALAGPNLLHLPEWQASEEAVVGAVLRWLREHPGWLVILDNVDTKEAASAVREILPFLSGGRVLLTSRLSRWPPDLRKQELETMTPADAVRFLLQRTETEREKATDDPAQARRLADVLGGLPLALEQAAAYIGTNRMRFADYLEEWEKDRAGLIGWYDAQTMRYPAPVAITWKKTFDQLGPTAGALLRLTAFLAPDPIQIEMFEKGEEFMRQAAELLAEETNRETDSAPLQAAVADLAAYSMAARPDRQTIVVHRLVQEALRGQIPGERRGAWIELSLRTVNRFAPAEPGDVRTWPVWDRLRPHATAVVAWADNASITDPTSRLMNNLGQLLDAKGLYAEAEPLMRRTLAIAEASFEDPRVAIRLNNLAQLLRATNRLAEAEPLMRRALAIDEASFGNEHPNVARDLNNLALLLKDTNRLAEAEPLMRRALAIDEAAFGNEHPEVAIDLNNLAHLLKTTNRLAEAEPLMRRALAIDEAAFGNEHPKIATRLNNLALLLQDTNRLAEAEPLMRRAVKIYERSLGHDHPLTQNAQRNLAGMTGSSGD
jgi:tetratricopeptide (TPR) repeat protein